MQLKSYLCPILIIASVCLLILVLCLCQYWPKPVPSPGLEKEGELSRNALVMDKDPFGDEVKTIRYLDQGWSPRDSMDFYTHTQGSRLIPYTWFTALEQSSSERPFSDSANMNRLRYLPQLPSSSNPDGLPVGFVKDPARSRRDQDWLGLTCAACHTTQINYKQVGYRIDGGPSMADQEALLRELTAALKSTRENQQKFDRFATKILPKNSSEQDKNDLRKRLANVTRFREEFELRNKPDHPYGFARLDAFGRILNEVLVVGLQVAEKEQAQVPNAPVSYPFLWDTPHHDVVQWNGIARNRVSGSQTLGSLTRNVGEVLGVFGEINLPKKGDNSLSYDSSVRVTDLMQIENLVRKLQSPMWPSSFPEINEESRRNGEQLFAVYCVDCHPVINRKDPNRTVVARMTPLRIIGTDERMAKNFNDRIAKTGRLEGKKTAVLIGDQFGKEAGGDAILTHVVLGVILNTISNHYEESDLLRLRRPSGVLGAADNLKYKARPLNGIWATAPYLHNGSVPNLYQLLLPAEERASEFWVGRREFDPKYVGFKTEQFEGGFRFRTKGEDGKPILGNSNAGHEYGTGKSLSEGGDSLPKLQEAQIWDLIEYMKSL
jgi:hypothetical protein